jgi:ABC-type transport system substrate-binding protein
VMLDAKRIANWQKLKSIEVIDDYTLKFTLTDYPYDAPVALLNAINMFSPTAFKTNGKDWCYQNAVATGPFQVTEFKRDVSITMKKFDNYWGKSQGYPYLDGVVMKQISDSISSQAMMESKQVDIWENMPVVSMSGAMVKKGFKANYTGPVQKQLWYLYPEVKPTSIFNDIKVRQAVAAAIDTEAIAEAVGKGTYEGLHQLVPKGLKGYNPNYKGIPFDPAKARQLLTEAGYPTGFKTNLYYSAENSDMADAATAIQAFLSDVGISAEIVALTQASYFPAIFGKGWDGLLIGFAMTGNDPFCVSAFSTFMGPNRSLPFSLRPWSQEVLDLLDKGLHSYDTTTRATIGQQLIKAASDQQNVIPLYCYGMPSVLQPWVHDVHPADGYGVRHMYKVWMEAH